MEKSEEEIEIHNISKNFLRKKFFVMLRYPNKNELAKNFFKEHLNWVINLEKSGVIFCSGPFVESEATKGKPGSPAGGMTILRANSISHAIELVRTDPYVINEIVSFELKEWLVMEGGFSLRLSFSQGSYEIN
jgi:hypothetical protein